MIAKEEKRVLGLFPKVPKASLLHSLLSPLSTLCCPQSVAETGECRQGLELLLCSNLRKSSETKQT